MQLSGKIHHDRSSQSRQESENCASVSCVDQSGCHPDGRPFARGYWDGRPCPIPNMIASVGYGDKSFSAESYRNAAHTARGVSGAGSCALDVIHLPGGCLRQQMLAGCCRSGFHAIALALNDHQAGQVEPSHGDGGDDCGRITDGDRGGGMAPRDMSGMSGSKVPGVFEVPAGLWANG